ncbi:hypothetical protein [Bacillus halotolerans]|uniref:hypothetical protein n=1 Tax=Bacillus halotolerans TaxID=260554 RepID=UPI000D055AE1|nr:hypothetical protein [Bacillus halotolerans]PSB00065.1 hypothetical protein C6372_05110 [Bacillus halotolerans]
MYMDYWQSNPHNYYYLSEIPYNKNHVLGDNWAYTSNYSPELPRNDVQNQRQTERRISLLTSAAPEVNQLGNGFFRYSWDSGVGPKETLICFLEGDGLNVITGGFAFVGSMAFEGNVPPIYLLESYPYAKNRWVISLHNPSNDSRRLRFYLIAKR